MTTTTASADVWDVLREQFSLSHEINRPEVQAQIHWFLAHPSFIEKICEQSKPYIYHILIEIKKRRLPGELALLPMLESAYNPFAYSEKGASGLWQLMPKTGSDLGLKQDWWFDGRRGVRSSTEAALSYLLSLNQLFNGDWELTLAAYDAGAGTLSRAIKLLQDRRQVVYFWNLLLPKETTLYVPRFLALAELIKNPSHYNIELPKIPCQPYFEEVNIGSPIDLDKAARLAGIPYKELIKLNPGFNRWTTPPYKPFQLLIPKENVERFSFNLATVPNENRVSWTKYAVQQGDNLASIANRYHTTPHLLKEVNQLPQNEVKPLQLILIPSHTHSPIAMMAQTPSPLKPHFIETQTRRMIHIVQNDERFQDIEKKYGVSSQEIQLWNQLLDKTPLSPGQQLIIFKKAVR